MTILFEKYIKDTLEAKELGNAYQFVFDKMENEGQALLDNQFILSADETTIKEWELWLDIPFDSSLTLDERRQQILLKLNMKPPYTFNNVRKQIASFAGRDVTVVMNNQKLFFGVETVGLSTTTIKFIFSYLKRVLPVNVVYVQVTIIDTNSNEYYGAGSSISNIYNGHVTYIPPTEYNKWNNYISDTWQDVLSKGSWRRVMFNG